MSGILLPVCSIFFSGLLCLIYFFKKRINIIENKMYNNMLICSFLDSVLVSVLQILALNGVVGFEKILVVLFNKIDFILLIIFCNSLLLYTLFITINKIRENSKKFLIISAIIDIISFVIISISNVEVVFRLGNYTVQGSSINCTYIICFIYIFLSILTVLLNLSKIDKRHLPIFAVMLMIVVLLIVFKLDPFLIVISIVLTFIDYIMYFTIENPDMKIIEELNLAKDNAIKANLAKSDFLSSMSHEIRTPLNAIVGLSEDMRFRNNCPIDMKEDLDDVVSASKTLLEIVGNIMDISKIESDKMEIVDVCYNFKEEVETLARVNATRIGDKQINFNVNIAEDIPYELMGDKIRIKQIINNLLSNAMKYTEKGNIDFSVKCINQDEKCLLIITVKDTGRGIKAENINKLFSKFERLDIEKNSTTEGTGLGLAITKKLVEMMGGTINVESSFGKGSIFMVQIPQRIKRINKPFTEEDISDVGGYLLKNNNFSGKKILIVDDNKLNVKVAKRSLDGFGFIIDECFNGLECLNKIKAGEVYDIILMDIMMPVMSGETAIKELCNMSNFSTPVIALTADALVGAEEKYRSIGFVDYISKPFTKEQIKSKLDKILSNNSLKYNPKIDRFAGVEPVIIGNDND